MTPSQKDKRWQAALGKTALQHFADWMAPIAKNVKIEVTSSPTVIVFRQLAEEAKQDQV